MSTGVRPAIEVRTSASAYEVGATVGARVVNHTGEDVYVSHCNHRVSLLLQRRAADGWVHDRQVNGPVCQAIHPMGELAIAPGRDVTETLQIDEAGEFRLQVHVRRAHEDFGSLVATSPSFTVRDRRIASRAMPTGSAPVPGALAP